MLDAWLDRLFDEGDETMIELFSHIVENNNHWINCAAADVEVATLGPSNNSQNAEVVNDLRSALREQLHTCLFMLDLIEAGHTQNSNHEQRNFELMERLHTLSHHLQFHLEALDNRTLLSEIQNNGRHSFRSS
jgi:hypothetical protein